MSIDSKNTVNLNLKKEEKVLDFNDFQKQNLKFYLLFLDLNQLYFLNLRPCVIVIYLFVLYICIIHLSHFKIKLKHDYR